MVEPSSLIETLSHLMRSHRLRMCIALVCCIGWSLGCDSSNANRERRAQSTPSEATKGSSATPRIRNSDSAEARAARRTRTADPIDPSKIQTPQPDPQGTTEPAETPKSPNATTTATAPSTASSPTTTSAPATASAPATTRDPATTNANAQPTSPAPRPITSTNIPIRTKRVASQEDPSKNWIDPAQLPREYWEVWLVGSSPVGYLHHISTDDGGGRIHVRIESLTRISRNGQKMEQKLVVDSLESTTGELKNFEVYSEIGDAKTKMEGHLDARQTYLTITTRKNGGGPQTRSIPWKKNYRGPFAVEQSIKRLPLVLGEQRMIEYFDPMMGEVVEGYMECISSAKTPVFSGTSELLTEVQLLTKKKNSNDGLRSTLWSNADGEVLKLYSSPLDLRSFRCDRMTALKVKDAAAAEILSITEVALANPIRDVKTASSIQYRIYDREEDPYRLISKKTHQKVRSLSQLEAEVTTYRIDATKPLPEGIEIEKTPDAVYLQGSPLLESDDPRVKQLAKQFAEQGDQQLDVVERLRLGVHKAIAKKNFTKALSSAAEVASQLEGDCTEHAMLLAAVARASGIPSRLAVGLVYMENDGRGVMAYHMWTEMWVNDRWVGADAVFPNASVGPDHLKFFETAMESENPYGALLPVLETLGKIKITVTDVKY